MGAFALRGPSLVILVGIAAVVLTLNSYLVIHASLSV
jgi:hypothetical protein